MANVKTLSAKPEVHNSNYHTSPEKDRATVTVSVGLCKNLVKFGRVVSEICGQIDRQTDRQTHKQRQTDTLTDRLTDLLVTILRTGRGVK